MDGHFKQWESAEREPACPFAGSWVTHPGCVLLSSWLMPLRGSCVFSIEDLGLNPYLDLCIQTQM